MGYQPASWLVFLCNECFPYPVEEILCKLLNAILPVFFLLFNMPAETIVDVINFLDTIVDDCIRAKSRLGYFACLYRKMTISIRDAIANKAFEDGARMEKLDVYFANRYLEAYDQHMSGKKPTLSWQTAFHAAAADRLTVLQHLLLGINAHINLDLGIAAARVSTPETIGHLYNDFNKVNEVIGTLFGAVQSSLTKIAFPMYFIRKIDPKKTGAVLDFSISKARQTAWANALLITEIGDSGEKQVIETTDRIVSRVAQGIQSPRWLMSTLLRWIRWTESKDIAKNILCLD